MLLSSFSSKFFLSLGKNRVFIKKAVIKVMRKSNFRVSFNEIGLNKYEELVYLILVEEGMATAKNISDITGIPYGKVYEVAKSLANKGFLTVLPTKPTKYVAVSPKEACSNSKKQVLDKFNQIESQIAKELDPIFEKNKKFAELKSDFLLLKGRANINKKIEEMIKKSEDHIYILTSENGLKRNVMHLELLKAAHKRGVKITISTILTPGNKEDASALNFCKIVQGKNTSKHLFSFDGEEFLIVEPKEDDENLVYGRDIGLWVVGSSFSEFFEDFFQLNPEKEK